MATGLPSRGFAVPAWAAGAVRVAVGAVGVAGAVGVTARWLWAVGWRRPVPSARPVGDRVPRLAAIRATTQGWMRVNGFRRTSAGIELRLPRLESTLLTELLEQVDGLLQPPPVDDPLEALVGLRDTAPPPPEDPAVARLLPDPYPDDPMASGDFRRRRTDEALAHKRDAAARVLAAVPAPGDVLLLDEAAAQDWLTVLNDLRLVLGTRLGLTDDESTEELDRLSPDDPRLPMAAVYSFLTELLDELTRTLL
ncbi:protein of unknown function (DUF2017) [Parafrankia irregularis]|uniref:Uncharacterized protein n=2 Tax=Frankiales TaxID=85013 RepID=A0A0S4QQG3_9ACTN|nr:protein of unknown function (DUF2017) [Parafrankia irregularis]